MSDIKNAKRTKVSLKLKNILLIMVFRLLGEAKISLLGATPADPCDLYLKKSSQSSSLKKTIYMSIKIKTNKEKKKEK